jgi:hypothetical protein
VCDRFIASLGGREGINHLIAEHDRLSQMAKELSQLQAPHLLSGFNVPSILARSHCMPSPICADRESRGVRRVAQSSALR